MSLDPAGLATVPADHVELCYWIGCPSHRQAGQLLERILEEIGAADTRIVRLAVESDSQAAAERFIGSPTFRVAGEDVLRADPALRYGLTCRAYRLRDGRFSPLPDPADLRDALTLRLTEPGQRTEGEVT